jgi:hypothetical protein
MQAVLDVLILAAQGCVMHNEDASGKRAGTPWRIALFFSGWKHAGENIATVWQCTSCRCQTLGKMMLDTPSCLASIGTLQRALPSPGRVFNVVSRIFYSMSSVSTSP